MIKELLKQKLIFKEHTHGNGIYYYSTINTELVLLRLNNFPDEPLYSIVYKSQAKYIEDKPEEWVIDYNPSSNNEPELIGEYIKLLIPPSDYQHRNGFSNNLLIDILKAYEKELIEERLIELLNSNNDLLIVETLAYMKSTKALPILYKLLEATTDHSIKLATATFIYLINGDTTLIDKAVKIFKDVEERNDPYNTYSLTDAFYYLSLFKTERANALIEKYINHKDFLVSNNAKRYLGIEDKKSSFWEIISTYFKQK